MPEVVLAGERGLPYASLCLVANPAAGLGPEISVDDVMAEVDGYGCDLVEITGGEPLVRRDLPALIRSLAALRRPDGTRSSHPPSR